MCREGKREKLLRWASDEPVRLLLLLHLQSVFVRRRKRGDIHSLVSKSSSSKARFLSAKWAIGIHQQCLCLGPHRSGKESHFINQIASSSDKDSSLAVAFRSINASLGLSLFSAATSSHLSFRKCIDKIHAGYLNSIACLQSPFVTITTHTSLWFLPTYLTWLQQFVCFCVFCKHQ